MSLDRPARSTLEDEADEDEDNEDEDDRQEFAFPELDARIREAVREYGAVFPKLNFSSPKDASWLLPSSSPLKCTAPADVYILLKSSDFITHDLSTDIVFEGCEETSLDVITTGRAQETPYELELVLRKWYAIDRSREIRCFVRNGALIGLSQRDTNFYDFLAEAGTQTTIVTSVRTYWETHVKSKWTGPDSYVFDVLLTRDLTRFHILDFNPYAPRTDPLLFTYEELRDISTHIRDSNEIIPHLRIIDSPAHPVATRNTPAHQHNMVPFEALSLSEGRDVDSFRKIWEDEIKKGMDESDDEDYDKGSLVD